MLTYDIPIEIIKYYKDTYGVLKFKQIVGFNQNDKKYILLYGITKNYKLYKIASNKSGKMLYSKILLTEKEFLKYIKMKAFI